MRFHTIALAGALASVSPLSHADVLSFDDLSSAAFFTANYQGFQFGTNIAANNVWFHTTGSSASYQPHSGTGFVATDASMYSGAGYEAAQPISSATPFVFQGAWFSGGGSVGYQLYLGTTLVSTSVPSADLTSAPVFVASGYTGTVTSVVVFGTQGFYAMDDFTFAPVPEPAAATLMLAGLLGVAGLAARRQGAVASQRAR